MTGKLDERDATPEEEAAILAQQAIDGAPHSIKFEQVKAEAGRRIELIMPDYKQRNALAMNAEAMQLYGADPKGWPTELQQMNTSLMAQWAEIKHLRSRSNEIEKLDPIPLDYTDDKYWS
jgi:hypothetical protein